MSASDALQLPLLRFRQGNEDGYFEKPITIVGPIVEIDEHSVTIDRGRSLRTALYLADLVDPFGCVEMLMSVLADAYELRDVVSIALHPDRITYDNLQQYERVLSSRDEL